MNLSIGKALSLSLSPSPPRVLQVHFAFTLCSCILHFAIAFGVASRGGGRPHCKTGPAKAFGVALYGNELHKIPAPPWHTKCSVPPDGAVVRRLALLAAGSNYGIWAVSVVWCLSSGGSPLELKRFAKCIAKCQLQLQSRNGFAKCTPLSLAVKLCS